jgi:transcriptional regulator with XRE-family HTH domain
MQTTHSAVSAQPKKRRNRATLSLAELVQMRLSKLRINAQSLSRRSGLSPSYICRLLSGERLVNDDETALKLAKGIQLDWTEVFRAARNSRARQREAKLQKADPSLSVT